MYYTPTTPPPAQKQPDRDEEVARLNAQLEEYKKTIDSLVYSNSEM